MLRSIDPIISAPLLATLHGVRAGHWVAITSKSLAQDRPSISTSVSIELLAGALFPALQVSSVAANPLVAWLSDPAGEESLDAFFAVQGTARDAERRRIEMARLAELAPHVWDNVDAVVTVDSAVDFAFFVCVGGESREVVDLFAEPAQHAA